MQVEELSITMEPWGPGTNLNPKATQVPAHGFPLARHLRATFYGCEHNHAQYPTGSLGALERLGVKDVVAQPLLVVGGLRPRRVCLGAVQATGDEIPARTPRSSDAVRRQL